jgi:hypothetical protein
VVLTGFNMGDNASANGFEGQLRHVDPLMVIGGVEMLASLGWCEINQDKINLFAAATSTSTSAASDSCWCGCRARLPDLGTVDIRSASPDRTKPLACRVLSLLVDIKIIIERSPAEGYSPPQNCRAPRHPSPASSQDTAEKYISATESLSAARAGPRGLT